MRQSVKALIIGGSISGALILSGTAYLAQPCRTDEVVIESKTSRLCFKKKADYENVRDQLFATYEKGKPININDWGLFTAILGHEINGKKLKIGRGENAIDAAIKNLNK